MTLSIKAVGLSTAALLVLLLFTNPAGLPSISLTVPFILLFIIIFLVVVIVLGKNGVSRSKRQRIGLLITSPIVLLLALQSLGQLTLRDTLAVMILFGLGYFYVSRLATVPTR